MVYSVATMMTKNYQVRFRMVTLDSEQFCREGWRSQHTSRDTAGFQTIFRSGDERRRFPLAP